MATCHYNLCIFLCNILFHKLSHSLENDCKEIRAVIICFRKSHVHTDIKWIKLDEFIHQIPQKCVLSTRTIDLLVIGEHTTK